MPYQGLPVHTLEPAASTPNPIQSISHAQLYPSAPVPTEIGGDSRQIQQGWPNLRFLNDPFWNQNPFYLVPNDLAAYAFWPSTSIALDYGTYGRPMYLHAVNHLATTPSQMPIEGHNGAHATSTPGQFPFDTSALFQSQPPQNLGAGVSQTLPWFTNFGAQGYQLTSATNVSNGCSFHNGVILATPWPQSEVTSMDMNDCHMTEASIVDSLSEDDGYSLHDAYGKSLNFAPRLLLSRYIHLPRC